MKPQKITILIVGLFSIMNSLFAQKSIDFKNSIDDLVYNQLNIDFDRSPGFIVGLIEKDSIFTFSYGTIDKDSIILPRPDNLFEIGNLTNVFTARLVNVLVEKNILEKNISINNYLPDSLQNSTAELIKIEHLLTHTSGLPRVPLGIGLTQKEDNQPYKYYTKKMLAEYFKSYDFSTAEIGKYNYSHLGYALIELIIEYKTSLDFEKVLQDNLLNNKFTNTKINLTDKEKKLLVQGFDKSHKTTQAWEYASFSSAIGLKSNLTDLLVLLRDNIDDNTYNTMQVPLVPTGMEKNILAGEGWHIIQPKKYYPIVVHTGATSGYRGYMAFVKETRTGLVVLSNSEYALRGLGYLILKELNRNFRKKRQ